MNLCCVQNCDQTAMNVPSGYCARHESNRIKGMRLMQQMADPETLSDVLEKAYFTFKACTDLTQQSWRDENGMKGIVMSERNAFRYAVFRVFEDLKTVK